MKHQHRLSQLALPVTALAAGMLVTASPAVATFPGVNGKILYDTYGSSFSAKIKQIGGKGGGGASALIRHGFLPSSSPDGGRIVFQRIYRSQHYEGFSILDRASDSVTSVISDEEQKTRYASGLQFMGPSGDQIVFSSAEDPRDGEPSRNGSIWLMNADGSGRHALTRLDGGHYSDFSPTSSPRGDLIVFTRYIRRDEGRTEIYAMQPDGSGVHRVTFSGKKRRIYNPDVSPDGKRVVFEFDVPHSNRSGIATAPLGHSGPVRVLANGYYEDPSYSPNGKRILALFNPYPKPCEDNRLVTLNLRGGDREFVSRCYNGGESAVWAPRSVG